MKRSMLKRMGTGFIVVAFILTTLVSMMGLTFEAEAAAASDFVLTHSCTTSLSKGELFQLPLKMRNLTASTISDIELDFSASGIAALTNGGTVSAVDPFITVAPSPTELDLPALSMRFTGDGSNNMMPVKVTYSLDGGATFKETTVNLYLTTDGPSSPPPDPIDTRTYKPVLQTTLTGSDSVSAGSSSTLHINIKNISTTSGARNVVFVPVYDKTSPFVMSKAITTMPVSNLQIGSSTEVSIQVDVDKFAQSGIVPFAFKLSCVNAWNDEFVSEHTVYLQVSNYQSNASFDVQLPAGQNVEAVAGGTFDLPVILMNNGSMSARDVKVSLSGMSQDTFMLASGTGKVSFTKLLGNETRNISYTLKASSALKSGSYPVSFDISFIDEKGTAVAEKLQLWIPVTGNEGQASVLEILEITPSQTTVKPGESFDVSVKVKNSGNNDARQIKVSADGGTQLLPVSQNLFIISSLKAGETKNILFKFQPIPEAARGGVPITIKVESVDGNNQNLNIAQAISVFIDSASDGKPQEGKNVPKIIVKNYSTDPALIKAGEKFTLSMQFLNTHAERTVKNIKGSFIVTEGSNETGNVFSPVDSSNTFYIDEIGPKGTCDWTLNLYTIPDAKSKTYTVTVSFEYEDDAGMSHKADEIIGIPVYQPSRFEVSEFSLPPEMPVGQPVYLAFEMYNMGKTDIYNVKLNVEGDFDAMPKSNYFGNFESGRREYFELNLIPKNVGQTSGRIVFQYETASGEKQEYVKEISMNVTEMMMPPDGEIPVDGKPIDPGMQEPAKKGFIGSVWFYVAIGVVVVGVVVTVILVARKRKKNKEFDF